MNSDALKGRYPAWNAPKYPDGYYNARAGWAESGRVVERMLQDAQTSGVLLRSGLSMKKLMRPDQESLESSVIKTSHFALIT